jgi:hypothetical protein
VEAAECLLHDRGRRRWRRAAPSLSRRKRVGAAEEEEGCLWRKWLPQPALPRLAAPARRRRATATRRRGTSRRSTPRASSPSTSSEENEEKGGVGDRQGAAGSGDDWEPR